MIEPATASVVGWIDPLREPAPQGKKVLLLSYTGVAVIGTWANEGYVAWAPLPKIPDHVRRRIESEEDCEDFFAQLNKEA
jgi:hypothetical protein